MFESVHPSSVSVAASISTAADFPIEKIGTWLSAVIQSSLDGVLVVDAAARIVLSNREAGRMFGYPAEQLPGEMIDILFPVASRAEQRAQIKNFAVAQVSGRRLRIRLDLQGLHAAGQEILINAAIARVIIDERVYLAIILRELLERTLPDVRLTLAQSTLRKLALSSQQATEIEKRRFSKELYDDLGQRLSVLKLDLDWLENSPLTDLTIPTRIAQMQHLLDNIIIRTKSIASTLRPSILDDFGLLAAAEWMVDAFGKKTGIACQLINHGVPSRPGDQVESAVFRVLQESLLNVERHAQARHVTIRLWHTDQHLHVTIEDDGIGLHENSRDKSGCHGLSAMRERIYMLDGTLSIKSSEPHGLTIHASIPFQV